MNTINVNSIMQIYLAIAIFIVNINIFSQDNNIFLSSESDNVAVLEYTNWYADKENDFEGVYQMIVPSDGEYDGQSEKLKLIDVLWSNEIGAYSVFGVMELEVADWNAIDTLRNSMIVCEGESLTGNSCIFKCESSTGEYVVLKYKTLKGRTKETKGLLVTKSDNPGYKYFYEKVKSGSGGFSEKNSIIFSGKELKFGSNIADFTNLFPVFSSGNPDMDYQTYKYGTNYDDAFSNYWITAKFKNDILVCFELNGWQTDEYMKIINETLLQFTFDRTVIEKDEEVGDIRTDYYHKDELRAEYFSFETSVLTICLTK